MEHRDEEAEARGQLAKEAGVVAAREEGRGRAVGRGADGADVADVDPAGFEVILKEAADVEGAVTEALESLEALARGGLEGLAEQEGHRAVERVARAASGREIDEDADQVLANPGRQICTA